MKTKTLGIHLGTTSIGWAVSMSDKYKEKSLLDSGVLKFKDGVYHDQKEEKPMTQERTAARAKRRLLFRKRLRKVELLKVLVRHDLCPHLDEDEIMAWKKKKIYPVRDEFRQWLMTDMEQGRNPYADRNRCLKEKLDFSSERDRHTLGRALYHITQRRGFLSNRKESTKESNGSVIQGIVQLNKDMAAAGCTYLGEFFFQLLEKGESIRGHHTGRLVHYRKEFDAICERQGLGDELKHELERAIFFQRPLKSQKGSVGRCMLEKSQARCRISHPQFEEFRMLQDLNNIKIKTQEDENHRSLTDEEKKLIEPLFFRKSKPYFPFEQIARKLAGKGNYGYFKDKDDKPVLFNYPMIKTFSTCVVTAELKAVFGEDWLENAAERYALRGAKTLEQIQDDIWHVLESFDDNDRLSDWAKRNLSLSDDEAKAFTKISLPDGYASLSLRAIRRMLPYLRSGYRYDEAVIMANLRAVMYDKNDEEALRGIEKGVTDILKDNTRDVFGNRPKSVRDSVEDYLKDCYDVNIAKIDRLYSRTDDLYPESQLVKNGKRILDSPRIPALKNPMVMRALFMLRHLVNDLIVNGLIDENTKINIELSRELNDSNTRYAISRYQKARETARKSYIDAIMKFRNTDEVPSDSDILKFQLWEEQKHICPYTLKEIPLADVLGPDPNFVVDFIVPCSRNGEDSIRNKVLCDRHFNNDIKKDRLPSELANHSEIVAAIESFGWLEEMTVLRKRIEGTKRASGGSKSDKDDAIRRRRLAEMELAYIQGKVECFTCKEAPRWLPNMEGSNTAVIRKYAKAYLQTVFDKVYSMTDIVTAAFRKMWGVEKYYQEQKECSNSHYAINAITLSCIGKNDYDLLARFIRDTDAYKYYKTPMNMVELPWEYFLEDIQNKVDNMLVPYFAPDHVAKKGRRKLKKNGVVQTDKEGRTIYVKGDSARGSMHKDTFYGAIKHKGKICYVRRKELMELKENDIEKIVDKAVREKVAKAVCEKGFETAIKEGIIINEALGTKLRKVRLFTTVANPIRLKRHQQKSVHEHKRDYYVTNDNNYAMAIYEDIKKNGKSDRSYRLINYRDTALYYNGKTDREHLFDIVNEQNQKLYCVLKKGSSVLLYEESPQELYSCTQEELSRRLYRVTGLSASENHQGKDSRWYGTIQLRHHMDLGGGFSKGVPGKYKVGEEFRTKIQMMHGYIKALVDGKDFRLSPSGKIEFTASDNRFIY